MNLYWEMRCIIWSEEKGGTHRQTDIQKGSRIFPYVVSYPRIFLMLDRCKIGWGVHRVCLTPVYTVNMSMRWQLNKLPQGCNYQKVPLINMDANKTFSYLDLSRFSGIYYVGTKFYPWWIWRYSFEWKWCKCPNGHEIAISAFVIYVILVVVFYIYLFFIYFGLKNFGKI